MQPGSERDVVADDGHELVRYELPLVVGEAQREAVLEIFVHADDGGILADRLVVDFVDSAGDDAAAEQLAKAREDGGAEFSSIEDFEIRSGAGKSTVDLLKSCGAFGDLPDSDQMSLF